MRLKPTPRVATCTARTAPTAPVADAIFGANQFKSPSVFTTRTFSSFKSLFEKCANNWVQVIVLKPVPHFARSERFNVDPARDAQVL
jgi:hypothetical protein